MRRSYLEVRVLFLHQHLLPYYLPLYLFKVYLSRKGEIRNLSLTLIFYLLSPL